MTVARLPLPDDPRYYVFSDLHVDAALYEPDASKFRRGMVGAEQMEAILRRAVADLAAAGFDVRSEAVANRPLSGQLFEHPARKLIPALARAVEHPEERREALSSLVQVVEQSGLPLLQDRRYYVLGHLAVYASLYLSRTTRRGEIWIGEPEVQAALTRFVGDLRASGVRVDSPTGD
jgi:hypothetical protein